MKIITKNSDKLLSMVHESKMVHEYLVYLLDDSDSIIWVDVVYGDADRDRVVKMLLTNKFPSDVNAADVVSHVSFDDFIKNISINE